MKKKFVTSCIMLYATFQLQAALPKIESVVMTKHNFSDMYTINNPAYFAKRYEIDPYNPKPLKFYKSLDEKDAPTSFMAPGQKAYQQSISARPHSSLNLQFKNSESTDTSIATLPSFDTTSTKSTINLFDKPLKTSPKSKVEVSTSRSSDSTITSHEDITLNSSISLDTTVENPAQSINTPINKSKLKTRLLHQVDQAKTVELSAPINQISQHPEFWITNNQPTAVQMTIYLRIPYKIDSYDLLDAFSYENMSRTINLESGQATKIEIPEHSILASIVVAYNPIVQPGVTSFSKPIFQTRKNLNFAQKMFIAGQKQHAHSLNISDNSLQINKISRTQKNTLFDLSL